MSQTEQVKFSICIPAYKSRHLKVCIESILKQTVADFELIILNDCSPEQVEEIATHFGDNRLHYYKNKTNTGGLALVDNWNKCLDIACGEYIMIMGDDDILEPDYLEEFSNLISAYPDLDVYHCRSQIIDDKGDTHMLTPALPAYENVFDSIWHRLNQWRSNYISDYVYKRESLKARGGFYYLPYAWGSDDITAFIASAEKGIAHSNKPVFKYRSHGQSISSNTGNAMGKLLADVAYGQWLTSFLEKAPHEGDLTIYRHLLANSSQYMRKRKIFTMTKLMQNQPVSKAWSWFQRRKELGITIRDIAIATLKSRRMKVNTPA